MSRWTLAGCMALAALGAVAVVDVGATTAEAAPTVSAFAGTYVGRDPRGLYSSWVVTISDGGQVTSSFGTSNTHKGSLSGRVGADGTYSFAVSVSGYTCLDERCRFPERWKSSYKSAGNMAPDADGNIVGTENTGASFSWLRQ